VSPELAASVASAYRAFAGERIGARLHVCRCPVCFGSSEAAERALTTTPLAEIPADLLAEYTNSAHEWDDEMLYFLPRYLDLIARGECPSQVAVEFSLSRLAWIDWCTAWPAARREALETFFAALLRDRLAGRGLAAARWHFEGADGGFYDRSDLAQALCIVANAGGDLAAALRVVAGAPGLRAQVHVAALVNQAGFHLCRRRLGWSLLGTRGNEAAAEAAIVDWLLDPRTVWRIEAAFFETGDAVEQSTLSVASSLLAAATGPGGSAGR
jgi:hypothetical protein